MVIHILTNYDFISYYFMYPLLVNKKRLHELNISIKYYDKITDSFFDCDIILLDSKYFRPLWENREKTISLLQEIREKSRSIIWLDTTDSTGATHFQVLPYVDKYWKKQLLRDLSLYEEVHYGARIYTDYYKKQFDLEDENVFSVKPLKKCYSDKLFVSWNLGAGPISINNQISNFMRLIPWCIKQNIGFKYYYKTHPPNIHRAQTVCFRGSNKYINKALSFQRLKTIEKIKAYGIETEPVKRKKYVNEIKNSKIGLSPFGAGEICFRDFEIILGGALLFKPSMNHLNTYPDIYIDNETYVSFKWDFNNFEEKLDDLLEHPDVITSVSFQAQKRYKHFFSEEGQEEFCKRLYSMLM